MLSKCVHRTKKEFSANRLEQLQNGKNTYYLINCSGFESTTNPSRIPLKDHKYALKEEEKSLELLLNRMGLFLKF